METYAVPPRTLGQKVRESLLAIRSTRVHQGEILAKYLNTVYFGQRRVTASRPRGADFLPQGRLQLSALESALLAGMIRAPRTTTSSSRRRRRSSGGTTSSSRWHPRALTPERAAQLEAREIKVDPIEVGLNFPGKLGYFLDYTRRSLLSEYDEGLVFGGGLQVTTTLDSQMQRYAEEAVANQLDTPGDPAAAVVAIDPRNGAVRAMYGGKNFAVSKVNLATGDGGSGRQAGSAFKPFTLATAIEQGYSLDSRWHGPSSITIPDPACYTDGAPWELSNAADEESGDFSLLAATTYSVNTVFAQVASAVTPEAIRQTATRMGIRSPLEPVCSITLGTQAVTPLEMTDAYGTLVSILTLT